MTHFGHKSGSPGRCVHLYSNFSPIPAPETGLLVDSWSTPIYLENRQLSSLYNTINCQVYITDAIVKLIQTELSSLYNIINSQVYTTDAIDNL